jgi:predicted SprT family Zn-dependent metalloprotease
MIDHFILTCIGILVWYITKWTIQVYFWHYRYEVKTWKLVMKSIIKLPYKNPPKNQEWIKDHKRGYLCRHKGVNG